ncbi:MAG: cation transporter [Patescibacteria group bacterium]|nr:cation transporter [Patescibacteria group bacterium]
MIKQTFKIEGMHCSSCVLNIDFDLEDLEGVKSCKTNYAKQQTEVEFDEDKIKPQQILDQIKKAGYNATVLDK